MIYQLHWGCYSAEIQCPDCMIRVVVENMPHQVWRLKWPPWCWWDRRRLYRAMLADIAKRGCVHAQALVFK